MEPHPFRHLGEPVPRQVDQATVGRDLEEMIARKLTFGEMAFATGFTLMSKQRLRMIQRSIFEQLERLNLLETNKTDGD